ncbi:MAG: hypothetical protein U5L45_06580 [Saprospiraceae bacterium]|nr:hypothetical protein [Saprospiraceae bacterium]
MVHFSGFARKNEPPSSSFCASEASAKVPFNAYFEFMYGFKNLKRFFDNFSGGVLDKRFSARFARRKGGEVVHFSGFARKMNHIPPFARAKRARKPAV